MPDLSPLYTEIVLTHTVYKPLTPQVSLHPTPCCWMWCLNWSGLREIWGTSSSTNSKFNSVEGSSPVWTAKLDQDLSAVCAVYVISICLIAIFKLIQGNLVIICTFYNRVLINGLSPDIINLFSQIRWPGEVHRNRGRVLLRLPA